MQSPTPGTNRLVNETSPYLLQHASNPVQWYPWGPEALERARELDRPIFLSIGYSACHWCHVMERESFENERIAAVLNEHFVSIKVDREERPDLDELYMRAVQTLTGSGGWPMSVFLTPEQEPFYGGTYFPPDDRHGRPGFRALLEWLVRGWASDRERFLRQARSLTDAIRESAAPSLVGELDPAVLERSLGELAGRFDPRHGGFGQAPKFPHAVDLRLCLRHGRRTNQPQAFEIVRTSLVQMAQGGLYDQLAGGFARYSTDERWLVPHFEKMLYDNALLVPVYLEAELALAAEGEEGFFGRIALETCRWALREMRTAEGAFASSLDADSEGQEGRFYAWTPAELDEVLGAETGRLAALYYDVTPDGTFEHGTSVLTRTRPLEELAREQGLAPAELARRMQTARANLLAARSRRVAPARDDKVLASWNGLMISALAQAAQVLDEGELLEAARAAARFVLEHMRRDDGRLFATYRAGRAHLNATLDDYAYLIAGLVDLYESDFDEAWLRAAIELAELVSTHFEDPADGGLFTTSDDHETLIARFKTPQDGALPAGSSVQILNLLRLAELAGEAVFGVRAERALRAAAGLATSFPAACSQLLLAVDYLAVGPREIVLAGERGTPEFEALLRTVRRTFLPQRVVAHAHPGADTALLPVLEGKVAATGARAFVCRNFTCGLPSNSPDELRAALA